MTLMPDDSTCADDMAEWPRREAVDTYELAQEHRDTKPINEGTNNGNE